MFCSTAKYAVLIQMQSITRDEIKNENGDEDQHSPQFNQSFELVYPNPKP